MDFKRFCPNSIGACRTEELKSSCVKSQKFVRQRHNSRVTSIWSFLLPLIYINNDELCTKLFYLHNFLFGAAAIKREIN